jgi:integrase
MDGQSLTKEPKTVAGRRSLSVPGNVIQAIIQHLEQFTDASPDALVFTGRTGIPLTRNVLQSAWDRARRTIGRPDLHMHDLRHTGLTLAAATGATTAELMHRAGHSSASAALRYQHATKDRDRVLADALEALVKPATVIPIDRESRASD